MNKFRRKIPPYVAREKPARDWIRPEKTSRLAQFGWDPDAKEGYRQLSERKVLVPSFDMLLPEDETMPGNLAIDIRNVGQIELSIVSTYASEKVELNEVPKVSIIVPTFNSSDFIRATLESIELQDYPNTEIIIVDDGSSDHTENIVLDFLDNACEQLKAWFVSIPHLGHPAATRNFGIFNLVTTASEYITFLDSDDLYSSEQSISSLVASFHNKEKCFAAFGGFDTITEDGRKIAAPKMFKRTKNGEWEWRKKYILSWDNLAKKLPRSLHLQCLMVRGGSPVMPYYRRGQDAGYYARLIRYSADTYSESLSGMQQIPKVLVHYRKRSTSHSNKPIVLSGGTPSNNRGSKKLRIPDFYIIAGVPGKYVTRENLSAFATRRWLPKIYKALFYFRFREATSHIKAAYADPNVRLRDLSTLFFSDLLAEPVFSELFTSCHGRLIRIRKDGRSSALS